MIARIAGLLPAALLAACAATPAPDTPARGPYEATVIAKKRGAPDYPREAAARGIPGCVTISFVVLPDGRADQYRVEDSVPQGLFDQATLLAMNDWRFEVPARPGRHAQVVEYRIGSAGQVPERDCARPTFEQLNAAPPPRAAGAPAGRELRILSKIMPAIPAGGAAGCVSVQFVIHPDGSVGEVAVVDAKPGTRYVPATLAALKQWRFERFEPPALRGRQIFTFDPEQVRLPDDAVRASFAVVGADGALRNEPCSAAPKPNAETSTR